MVFLLVKTEHTMSDICLLETFGLTLFTITGNRWAHVVLACGFHDYFQVNQTPARMSALRCAGNGPALTMHCLTNTKSNKKLETVFEIPFPVFIEAKGSYLTETGDL